MKKTKHFTDKRTCDHCGDETLELEQSSCVTSHVEEEKFKFLKSTCYKDSFYCSKCLNINGFCDKCAENVSDSNQKVITKYLSE